MCSPFVYRVRLFILLFLFFLLMGTIFPDCSISSVSAISGPCKSWGLCPPESETLCCSGKCETRYFLISMCAHVKTDEQQFGYDYSYQ